MARRRAPATRTTEQIAEMVAGFDILTTAYRATRLARHPAVNAHLFSDFGTALRRRRERILAGASGVLGGFEEAWRRRLDNEASTSPNVNPWVVLEVEHKELLHCRILAWLLDRRGSHAQGSDFFRAFLTAFNEDLRLEDGFADQPYRVSTEETHEESRIDLEVQGTTYLLHVEAKVRANEGHQQLQRESLDLRRTAASRGIAPERARGIFLAVEPAGVLCPPDFSPISWSQVGRLVGHFAGEVSRRHPENNRLPWLLECYQRVISDHVLRGELAEEGEQGEGNEEDSIR